jgi:hypothetical protein
MVHQMCVAACVDPACAKGSTFLLREDEWRAGKDQCPRCGKPAHVKPYSLDEWRNLAAAANQDEAKSV